MPIVYQSLLQITGQVYWFLNHVLFFFIQDDLEPYEKLLSPRRTTHPGKRIGRTTSQLNQANKVGGEQGGEGGVVKMEAEEGEERSEGGDKDTEEAGLWRNGLQFTSNIG